MPHYNSVKKVYRDGGINLLTDTIKCALLNSSYTPNIDNDDFWADISANEVSGTGYTAGGETLTAKTNTQDNTNDRANFDCDPIAWTGLTATNIKYAVFYKDTGVAATSQLIEYRDLGTPRNPVSSDFTLTPDAQGLSALG